MTFYFSRIRNLDGSLTPDQTQSRSASFTSV